jgi:hypothetical protein
MVVMEEISFRFVRRIHVWREIEEEEKKREWEMEREGFLGNFLNKRVFCRCCMFTVYLLTFWDSEISRFFYLFFIFSFSF